MEPPYFQSWHHGSFEFSIGPNWEDHDHSHHVWSLFSEGVHTLLPLPKTPRFGGTIHMENHGEKTLGFVSAVWIFGFQGTEFQPPPGGFTSCPWQNRRLQMSRWRRFRAILGCHATSALVTLFTTPNSWCWKTWFNMVHIGSYMGDHPIL